jgi:hypothetical protein
MEIKMKKPNDIAEAIESWIDKTGTSSTIDNDHLMLWAASFRDQAREAEELRIQLASEKFMRKEYFLETVNLTFTKTALKKQNDDLRNMCEKMAGALKNIYTGCHPQFVVKKIIEETIAAYEEFKK